MGVAAMEEKSSTLNWLTGETSSDSNRSSINTKAKGRSAKEIEEESSASCRPAASSSWSLQASGLSSHAQLQHWCAKYCVHDTVACRSFWSSFKGRLHNCLPA